MKNKTVLFLVVVVVLFFGWYLSFGTKSPSPLDRVQTSAIVSLKDGDTYDLTAGYVVQTVAGKERRMLAYNQMIPGPRITVAQGSRVTINFKNDTELPALLHSHGVRMDNAFDGAQTSQADIPPGGSFSYALKFPDTGEFWYHPHVAEVYEQPIGLYGSFLVTPTDPAYYPPANQEVPLFLSDLSIEKNGALHITPDTNDHALMGHYGNVLLVNGAEHFSLSVQNGAVVRFAFVNAANARPFNIAIAGARLKVVGGDSGAYEKAFFADSVVLGPSERVVVDVLFDKPGDHALEHKTPTQTYTLGTIAVSADAATPSYVSQFNILQSNKEVIASIDPFRSFFNKTPDKKLKLTMLLGGDAASAGMGGHMMPDGMMMGGSMGSMVADNSDGIEWEDGMPMMGNLNADTVKWGLLDQETGKVNMDIQWDFAKGVPVKIEIFNDPKSMHPMQHPIHFHGQRFLVISRNGIAQTNLVWKDTTLIAAGETVDIILDPSNPGTWMAHCHTAEHLQAGMMLTYRVQ